MKKNRSILLALFISLGLLLGIPNVYADDIPDVDDVDLSNVSVGDKFRVEVDDEEYNTYEVTEVEKDNIYIGSIKNNNKLSIYHFEINAYDEDSDSPYTSRKFVKLKDLCNETYKENGKKLNICKATKFTDAKAGTKINIQRQYINNINDTIIVKEEGKFPRIEKLEKEVYYSTDHELGTNEFKSLLYVNNGKGSTLENDEDLDEEERGNFYYFGDIIDDEAENERFDKNGTLTGDVETLIDENNDIYISVRFLTEALGARVDWLAQKIDNDTDAVLIRFYDSESYCKELSVNFSEYNKDFEGMYNKFLNETKTKRNDISFDLTYKYRNNEETTMSSAKWRKLFLGGYAVDNGFVSWDANKKLVVFKSDASKPSDINDTDFQEICPSENYNDDGELETLDDCIEVIGLINYYGVPIPIELLRPNNDECEFDNDHFEIFDKYDKDTDDDVEDDEANDENLVYLIGDMHVSKIQELYSEEDIEYNIYQKYDDFERKLNKLSNILDETKKYTFIFNMGNSQIDEQATLEEINNGSKDNVNSYVKDLAKKYSNLYTDFYENIENNKIDADIYIIQNMPIEDTDHNEFIDNFWKLLKIHKNINVIDVDDIEFEYEDGGMTYTDETYELIFNEIKDQITTLE